MKVKRLVVFFLILISLALLSIYQPVLTGKAIHTEYEREPALVLRVIDGDTIETDIGTIRLLGINTPERGKPYYAEAKSFLLPLENQSIELLRDFTDIDKYNRKLRYLFYNNRNINIEIIENGLATAYMFEDLRYEAKFLRAQNYAISTELGIWEKSNHQCAKCITLLELDAEEEFFILENQCSKDCNLEGWYVKDASRNTFKLEKINILEQIKIESGKSVWNNAGDEFFLRDAEGLLVIYYSY